MKHLAQINMKYLVAIAILMIILMLAVLLSHTEFGKGIKKMNTGVQSVTDDITQQADDIRNFNVFDTINLQLPNSNLNQ
jgi:hypothetical protein